MTAENAIYVSKKVDAWRRLLAACSALLPEMAAKITAFSHYISSIGDW